MVLSVFLQLEYDNTEGMILLSELSRRRIRSVQKLIRVGRNEVVVVLRVDKEKGTHPPLRPHPDAPLIPDLHRIQATSISQSAACRRGHRQVRGALPQVQDRRLYSAHVASKIPSVHGDAAAPAATPAEPATEKDKEHKRAVRKARQSAHDEDGIEHDIPGGANEDEKLEQLYDTVGWPLGKKYGHPYDAFKLALTYALPLSLPPLCAPMY